MSSSKSAHLGLHLWKPEDDFLRAEFNENSEMLDEAAAAARYATLLDVTTRLAAAQVDLDVSGIDFTALWEAELYCDASGATGANDTFTLLTNGLTTLVYWRAAANEYLTGANAYQWAFGPLGGGRSSFRLLTDNPDGPAIVSFTTGHLGTYNGREAFIAYHQVGMAPVTWRELETINVVHPNGSFPAGTRFFIRGVKR